MRWLSVFRRLGMAVQEQRHQQHATAIGGHAAAIKAGPHFAAALVGQIDCDPVCRYGVCSLVAFIVLIPKMLSKIHTPWLALW